jgi:hypothetical protein
MRNSELTTAGATGRRARHDGVGGHEGDEDRGHDRAQGDDGAVDEVADEVRLDDELVVVQVGSVGGANGFVVK